MPEGAHGGRSSVVWDIKSVHFAGNTPGFNENTPFSSEMSVNNEGSAPKAELCVLRENGEPVAGERALNYSIGFVKYVPDAGFPAPGAK